MSESGVQLSAQQQLPNVLFPTMSLRWYTPTMAGSERDDAWELQQLWRSLNGQEEWRPVQWVFGDTPRP